MSCETALTQRRDATKHESEMNPRIAGFMRAFAGQAYSVGIRRSGLIEMFTDLARRPAATRVERSDTCAAPVPCYVLAGTSLWICVIRRKETVQQWKSSKSLRTPLNWQNCSANRMPKRPCPITRLRPRKCAPRPSGCARCAWHGMPPLRPRRRPLRNARNRKKPNPQVSRNGSTTNRRRGAGAEALLVRVDRPIRRRPHPELHDEAHSPSGCERPARREQARRRRVPMR